MSAGPLYPKIHTVFKRDDEGVIIPTQYSEDEVDYIAGLDWTWTEKIDGTNIRLHFDGDTVEIGGRTDNAQIPAPLVQAIRESGILDPALWWSVFPSEFTTHSVTLYGEGFGAGIQKGGAYGPVGFIAFDCMVGDWWLRRADLVAIAAQLGVRVVPQFPDLSLIAMAVCIEKGLVHSRFEGVQIEGVVGHPLVELKNRRGQRLTVKLKVKDYDDLRRRS